MTLKIKINEVMTDYETISARALSHFKKNHSLSSISDSLLIYANDSRVTWKILQENRIVGRGILYKLFNRLRDILNFVKGN